MDCVVRCALREVVSTGGIFTGGIFSVLTTQTVVLHPHTPLQRCAVHLRLCGPVALHFPRARRPPCTVHHGNRNAATTKVARRRRGDSGRATPRTGGGGRWWWRRRRARRWRNQCHRERQRQGQRKTEGQGPQVHGGKSRLRKARVG